MEGCASALIGSARSAGRKRTIYVQTIILWVQRCQRSTHIDAVGPIRMRLSLREHGAQSLRIQMGRAREQQRDRAGDVRGRER